MESLDHGPADVQDIEALGAPFGTAAAVAFQEWAATEVTVQGIHRAAFPEATGELMAVVRFESGLSGFLALRTSLPTATALARRTFAGIVDDPKTPLVCDWLGEAANIIAGQAKALLLGTPYHFTFSPPRVGSGPGFVNQLGKGREGLVLALGSELGAVSLQLCLGPEGG